jgi:hypothetical protein
MPKDSKSTGSQKNRMAKNEFHQKWNRVRETMYRDYDNYDWSGKQVDKGSEVRRKGSDR